MRAENVQPRRLGEDRRRREVLRGGDGLGAERLLGLLEVVHRLATRRRRSTGSATSTGSGAIMIVISLPSAPLCVASVRTETGTHARSSSPSVSTPRSRMKCASPPATTASTTSLTVPPSASLISLNSSSSARTTASRRCGPGATLNGVGGGALSAADATSPTPCGDLAARGRRSACGSGAAATAPPATAAAVRDGALRRRAATSVARRRLGLRDPRLGGRRHRRALGREVEQDRREVDARDAVDQRVVGLGDHREAARRRAPRRATAPTAASSGRGAGRRCARRGAAARASSPGAGSAVWRTWYSRLNVGSSTHSGRPGLERRERELLPVARHEVQPRAHVARKSVERGRRALEQHDAADVHVRVRPLLREEPGVDGREAVEVLLRHVVASSRDPPDGGTWRVRRPSAPMPPDPAALAERAREEGRLGIDTEFMPEGRYRPLLCLVQIVVGDGDRHARPARRTRLRPRAAGRGAGRPGGRGRAARRPPGRRDPAPRVADGRHERLRHPGRGRASRASPRRPATSGCSTTCCKIRLAKSASFTRWDERPLTEEQLEYAARGRRAPAPAHRRPAARGSRARAGSSGRARSAAPIAARHRRARPRRGVAPAAARRPAWTRASARSRASWPRGASARPSARTGPSARSCATRRSSSSPSASPATARAGQIRGINPDVVRRRGRRRHRGHRARPRGRADPARGRGAPEHGVRRRPGDRAGRVARARPRARGRASPTS